MRLRVKIGLFGGLAFTIYALLYAVLHGDGKPSGLVVLGVVVVATWLLGMYLTSWLIDKRWPHLKNRR